MRSMNYYWSSRNSESDASSNRNAVVLLYLFGMFRKIVCFIEYNSAVFIYSVDSSEISDTADSPDQTQTTKKYFCTYLSFKEEAKLSSIVSPPSNREVVTWMNRVTRQ